jgi:hypothetical protein
MAINYVEKYSKVIDERFKEESKTNNIVNQDFSWAGTKTIHVYTINTTDLTDYTRTGTARYGTVEDLDTSLQEMTLAQDKAFAFAIDIMDLDETAQALQVGTALARQIREKVIPLIDEYRVGVIAAGAGGGDTGAVDKDTIFGQILAGTEALDEAEVPQTGRVLVVTPETYKYIKMSEEIIMQTDLSNEKRDLGIVGTIDGMDVLRIPSDRVSVANFAFMITHPVATVGPIKLANFNQHVNPPGINGTLVEGRVYFDAFVLDNKANAIYVHTTA